jgi:multidrug efflux pump subunit AcrB
MQLENDDATGQHGHSGAGNDAQASVGRIGARPIPENQQFQVNVQTQGRLISAEQFGDIVLRANADGSTLRIKDVARVELGAMNDDNFSRLNGRPAVTIGDLSIARR